MLPPEAERCSDRDQIPQPIFIERDRPLPDAYGGPGRYEWAQFTRSQLSRACGFSIVHTKDARATRGMATSKATPTKQKPKAKAIGAAMRSGPMRKIGEWQ